MPFSETRPISWWPQVGQFLAVTVPENDVSLRFGMVVSLTINRVQLTGCRKKLVEQKLVILLTAIESIVDMTDVDFVFPDMD